MALLARAQTMSGVRLGVQTYSFRELMRPAGGDLVDPIIAAMKECGLTECELWAPQIEPASTFGRGRPTPEQAQQTREAVQEVEARDAARSLPRDSEEVRGGRDDDLRVQLQPEQQLHGRGDRSRVRDGQSARRRDHHGISDARRCTRMVPFAAKHRMPVAMHNHSNVSDPNEFATLESLATALKLSSYFRVNLDIGHFTAANYDAVAYIREHHASITNLHIKDRKKNQGDNTAWGTGDTPIRDVLQLLKKERWPIRAYIEYEHRGEGGAVDEVKKCFAFAKSALA